MGQSIGFRVGVGQNIGFRVGGAEHKIQGGVGQSIRPRVGVGQSSGSRKGGFIGREVTRVGYVGYRAWTLEGCSVRRP